MRNIVIVGLIFSLSIPALAFGQSRKPGCERHVAAIFPRRERDRF